MFSTLWCKKCNAQTAVAEPPFMVTQLLTEIQKRICTARAMSCSWCPYVPSMQEHYNDIILLSMQIWAVPLPIHCPCSSLSSLHEKAFVYLLHAHFRVWAFFKVCTGVWVHFGVWLETLWFFLSETIFFFLLGWIIKTKGCVLEIVRERCHIDSLSSSVDTTLSLQQSAR